MIDTTVAVRHPHPMAPRVLLPLALVLACAAPVAAGPVEDVVAALEAEGYRTVAVSRTWLGRARVTATGAEGRREIVLVPSTGEVLRDVVLDRARRLTPSERAARREAWRERIRARRDRVRR